MKLFGRKVPLPPNHLKPRLKKVLKIENPNDMTTGKKIIKEMIEDLEDIKKHHEEAYEHHIEMVLTCEERLSVLNSMK